MRGTYALLVAVAEKINLQIGSLGKFEFPAASYLYAGSGQNSLEKRVERHIRKNKRIFWHIDYLLSNSRVKVKKVWIREGERWECQLARKIIDDARFRTIVPGFGSSDCRCETHLFLLSKPGLVDDFLSEHSFSEYFSPPSL